MTGKVRNCPSVTQSQLDSKWIAGKVYSKTKVVLKWAHHQHSARQEATVLSWARRRSCRAWEADGSQFWTVPCNSWYASIATNLDSSYSTEWHIKLYLPNTVWSLLLIEKWRKNYSGLALCPLLTGQNSLTRVAFITHPLKASMDRWGPDQLPRSRTEHIHADIQYKN